MSAEDAPAVIRFRRRWVAVGCSHGAHISAAAERAVHAFIADYKPHLIIHLGDWCDTPAFRAGYRGEDDADVAADLLAGVGFLERLRPHILFHGNHDERPYRWLRNRDPIKQYAAQQLVAAFNEMAGRLKMRVVEYAGMQPRCWMPIGGTLFGHGSLFNVNATRDHAEAFGRPVVHAHTHTQAQQAARQAGSPTGYSVGCMADIPSMGYAQNRRQTLAWQHGLAYGEHGEDWCEVSLKLLGTEGGPSWAAMDR